MLEAPTAPLTGPDVWRGAELAATPARWRQRFTADQLGALDDAADRLVGSGWPPPPGADLDAIAGRAPQDALIAAVAATGAPLWLDAGITSVEQARHALALGASRLVIGLETLRSYDDLAAICAAAGGDAVALSIDLRNGLPIRAAGNDVDERPEEIAVRAVRAGVGALIVLDLARVGTLDGPDVPLIAAVRRAAPGAMLLAAGGVRDPEDLDRLADAGCDGALVATALHEGRIGPGRQKSVQPRSVRRSV